MASSIDIATLECSDTIMLALVAEYRGIKQLVDNYTDEIARWTARNVTAEANKTTQEGLLAAKNVEIVTQMAAILEANRATLTPEQIAQLQRDDATVYTLTVEYKAIESLIVNYTSEIARNTTFINTATANKAEQEILLSAKNTEIVARMAQIITDNI